VLSGKISKVDNPRKYSAYRKRIQSHIDHMLDNLDWLAEYDPDILKYEEREWDDPNFERHLRLKRLLSTCVKISPYNEDPTIFKILGQIIPNFGIELVKRRTSIPSQNIKPMVIFRCKRCRGTFEEEDYKKKGNKCPHCSFDKIENCD